MEVRLVVTIAAVPGKGLELAQAFSRRAVDTRKEDGCNQFEAFVSADDPDRVVILERWRDQAALDAHRAAPHFKELGRKLGDYLAGRPDVQVMQEV